MKIECCKINKIFSTHLILLYKVEIKGTIHKLTKNHRKQEGKERMVKTNIQAKMAKILILE